MEQENEILIEDDFQNNTRFLAVKILTRFDRSDSYLDILIKHAFIKVDMSPQDKALLTELVNGVVRWRLKLDYVLIGFYQGDYQKCLNIIKNSMRIALYQMLYLDKVPDYAAIDESVEIVKRIQGQRAANVANGVLRNIARNFSSIRYPEAKDDFYYHLGILSSHPKWLSKRYCNIMGDQDAKLLMDHNNKRPYIPVRVNTLKSKVEDIQEIFTKHEIEYENCLLHPNTLKLYNSRWDIGESDLFRSGKIAIQDPTASLAVQLANPKPGQRVADICAAPGGKTFYFAELMNNEGYITAFDLHPNKLRFIEQGAERLGFDIIHTDTADAKTVVFNEKYDIIFADVPCSGLGTIRKKPDIKWKREFVDIKRMSDAQREIMRNVAEQMQSGGVFVYSTCTIDPIENEENIEWFLKTFPDFELDPAEKYLPKEICKNGMMLVWPHLHDIDGGFAARLIKK